jgi:hypothetical protein
MNGDVRIDRMMRPVAGVHVTQDFDVTGAGERWDPKRVPIVINSFDRVTYLRRLVEALRVRGYENLYIIDNHSTYEPLLQYYRDERLRVFYLDANVGYLALWTTPVGAEFVDDYYVYTDPDIEPAAECPADFIEVFHQGLGQHPRVDKVGFGLKIDDLPDAYALKGRVIEHEKQFLAARRGSGRYYRAAIDTTFALYRPGGVGGSWLRSLRTTEPYVARHLPWYEDTANPTAEELHYLQTIGASTHWSLRGGADASELEVQLAGQAVRVVAGASDDLWNVVSRGEWRPEVFDLIDRVIDPSHTFLEIGGGPGPCGLYAARTARKVFVLQPDVAALEELRRNAALNGRDAEQIESAGLRSARSGAPGHGATFAAFVASHELRDCALVSVDVGGRDWEYLPAVLPFLREQRPFVCVSLSPGRSWGLTTATPVGKLAIAALGVLSMWRLLWGLRFYRYVYDAGGGPLGPIRVLRVLSSRISVVAGDRPWPESSAPVVR